MSKKYFVAACKAANTTAPTIADPQPLISNPLRRPAAVRRIMAFKTKVKSPKVIQVMGSVKK